MKKIVKDRRVMASEPLNITEPEDVERICWENSARRAYMDAREQERLHRKKRMKELALLKIFGMLASVILVGLAVLSVLKAGWWAGFAPVVLAALVLEATGW